jgi:HK97 family phage prohead protease
MDYKIVAAEFKAQGDQGVYEGYFSVFGNVDDGGDVIHPGAFAKTIQERGRRVKVFYAHDWNKLIGPPPEVLMEDSKGLFARGRLTLDSFWGREVWALMKDGALTEGSIGYEAVKFDYDESGIRNLREVKLYEISPVPLGMNALTELRAVKAAQVLAQVKRAIPPHTTEMAPEDAEWDAAAVLREVEGARQLRLIHAWVDDDGDPQLKSSYKLPHHYADGRVVLKGVQAAGAAIMGARGGVDIPADDVAGVKRHLERHYHQFGRKAPWEEDADLDVRLETLTMVAEALKEGRVLSAGNKEKVQNAIAALAAAMEALQALLAAAEPEKALHSALLQEAVRYQKILMQIGG